jgi:hypothetical protein
VPFTQSRGTGPYIHSNIENLAFYNPDKFALRMGFLKMEAPEYASDRTGLVVLDKSHVQPRVAEIPPGIGLEKIPPAVAKNLRLYLVKSPNEA